MLILKVCATLPSLLFHLKSITISYIFLLEEARRDLCSALPLSTLFLWGRISCCLELDRQEANPLDTAFSASTVLGYRCQQLCWALTNDYITFIYLHVCECLCMCRGGQGTACRRWYFHYNLWVLGIELKSSALVLSAGPFQLPSTGFIPVLFVNNSTRIQTQVLRLMVSPAEPFLQPPMNLFYRKEKQVSGT